MKKLGLIGYPLSHSFSKAYFTKKFREEGIGDFQYDLYPLQTIEGLPHLLKKHPDIVGLNVTIPFKEQVIPYLDYIHHSAHFGAVNTILVTSKGKIGYNTDVYGFELSLIPLLSDFHQKALILGTGGAAIAVAEVLTKLGIKFQYVSRTPAPDQLSYESLDTSTIKDHLLIINTTPLGMYPNVESCPNLPYDALTSEHLLYDLIYNPEETLFLKKGAAQNTAIKNGLEMLILQAEKSWEIWTNYTDTPST